MRLPDDYLAACEKRARRFMGTWDQGTSGTLAADVMRLLKERKEIMASMEEINAGIREAVAARMAATPADDPKLVGYQTADCPGCEGHPFARMVRPAVEAQGTVVPLGMAAPADLEELRRELPPEFLAATKTLTFRPARPTPAAEFKVERIGGTLTPDQLEAAWAGVKARREEMLARMRGDAEPIETEVITPPLRTRIIGLTGPAGCGKTFVASMVPDAVVVGLADPIYAALASILGIPETVLRQRATKERPIEWLGKSPRQLLQTLGTDWGRTLVAEDLWLRIARRRIEELAAAGAGAVVIADVRFDNEAAMVHEMGGEVWLVDRRPATEAAPHVSEAGLSTGLIDRVIDNTGTPEQTRANVAAILASE
jgi:hypothetical protein